MFALFVVPEVLRSVFRGNTGGPACCYICLKNESRVDTSQELQEMLTGGKRDISDLHVGSQRLCPPSGTAGISERGGGRL